MKNEHDKTSLLSQWKSRKKTATAVSISKIPTGVKIPLSRGQQRLWFLQQLHPDNSFYNHAESYAIHGNLNKEHLLQSLAFIIEEHEILRSYFPLEDDETTLKTDEAFTLKPTEYDFSAYSLEEAQNKTRERIANDIVVPFDLSVPPLLRISLFKLSPTHHVLSINMHHIIIDEWSMRGLSNLLAKHYKTLAQGEALKSDELAIQYKDFAYWDRQREFPKNQLSYWREKLSGSLPVLELQTDYKRPLQPTFKGDHFSAPLTAKDSRDLLALAKKSGTTPFVVMLSLFYTLLYRYTHQQDILIGLPITSRGHESLEDLLGFFVDTVVLRTQFSSDNTFAELLSNVRKNTLEAFSNKDVPFDHLVKELLPNRSLAINPFFQVMFVYNADVEAQDFGPEIRFEKENDISLKSSKFDLTLFVNEKNGLLSTTFEYATDLFDRVTIERFSEHFNLLVKAVINNSESQLSKLPMLTGKEQKLFFEQVETPVNTFKKYKGIHQVIEDIAREQPESIAVTFGSEAITYRELNDRANVIAQQLLDQQEGSEKVIALSIERSTTMIVGMLAILKTGCAYLPIDPEYPEQRIDFILKDAAVKRIVTQNQLQPVFKTFDVELTLIDTIGVSAIDKPLPPVSSSDLAYVIYTSGSTGNPKGVPISHGNIINSTEARLDFYDQNPSAFLLMSSISFDSSKAGIFWTLCTGGNLVIAEKRLEQDIDRLVGIIDTEKVSHTLMLPSLYKLILEHAITDKLQSLTTVIVAGESCGVSLGQQHFSKVPAIGLYNEYGPTEATVWCIAHKVEPLDVKRGAIPIGKAVANAAIFILDAQLNPVPLGVAGELYIAGPGLAGKYINRLDLTRSSYVQGPDGETLYKTGDRAKYNVNGAIEFLGRVDQQIKVRGFRVELDEIEQSLNESSMVKKAVVLVETSEKKDIAIDSESTLNTTMLAKLLKNNLDDVEINQLLKSVELLKEKEKEYLLGHMIS